MTLTAPAYSRTQPLTRRRRLAAVLGMSVLLAQIFLPGMDSTRWAGVWPLLLLPGIAFRLHGLTSRAWVWNRLFRRTEQLDEYETHARNAFVARAYAVSGPLLWASFAAFLLGGGLLRTVPALNPFAGANVEVATALFIVVVVSLFDALPRIVAALNEPEAD
ncbi:hypothetical protein [Deinococcus budaensis]|uniref:Uncharacterized protein n=1 Tax=Deinococcus budaensis TaxID=1665626 RepID=A0A7W8GIU6_9DEIO|nr:hypothetical protein [Deinococcus budaensis]MBB5236114.1 hypothetical protein [Deinococcus budaensis]